MFTLTGSIISDTVLFQELYDRPLAINAAYKLDKLVDQKPKTLLQHLGNIVFPGWNSIKTVRKMANANRTVDKVFSIVFPRKFCAYHLYKMENSGKVKVGQFINLLINGGTAMNGALNKINRSKKKYGYIELHTDNPDFKVLGDKPGTKNLSEIPKTLSPTPTVGDPWIQPSSSLIQAPAVTTTALLTNPLNPSFNTSQPLPQYTYAPNATVYTPPVKAATSYPVSSLYAMQSSPVQSYAQSYVNPVSNTAPVNAVVRPTYTTPSYTMTTTAPVFSPRY